MRSALLITGSKWLVAFILRPRLEDLKHRHLDRSSPLDERLQPNIELSKQAPRETRAMFSWWTGGITSELTRRRESKHPPPHQDT